MEEPGSVGSREVVDHVARATSRALRNASSVSGLRAAVAFPGAELIKIRRRQRFLLESFYDTVRSRSRGSGQSVGPLLEAAFHDAPPDAEFDALLSQLDRIPFDAPGAAPR